MVWGVSRGLLDFAIICFSFDLILCIEWVWELALLVGWKFDWDFLYSVVGAWLALRCFALLHFNSLYLALYFTPFPSIPVIISRVYARI